MEAIIAKTKKEIGQKMELFKFNEALGSIWELLSFGDSYVNSRRPWENLDRKTISNLIVLLDNIAAFISPFMPETASRITENIKWISENSLQVKKITALFPRL